VKDTLLSEIVKIAELDKKATPGPWYDAGCCTLSGGVDDSTEDLWEEIAHPENCENVPYLAALRNASPEIFAAISENIHPQDTEKLRYAIMWLKTTNANALIIEAVQRCQALAEKLEEAR
jgi:hypothetical protein